MLPLCLKHFCNILIRAGHADGATNSHYPMRSCRDCFWISINIPILLKNIFCSTAYIHWLSGVPCKNQWKDSVYVCVCDCSRACCPDRTIQASHNRCLHISLSLSLISPSSPRAFFAILSLSLNSCSLCSVLILHLNYLKFIFHSIYFIL